MTLQEIYQLTNLKAIFSIEDEWAYSNSVEWFLYDLFRMNEVDITCFFEDIKDYGVYVKIQAAYNALKDSGFKIDKGNPVNKVISDDTDEKIESLVHEISSADLECIRDISNRYGIGLKERGSASLNKVLDGARDKCHVSLRIHNNFLSDDEDVLEKEVKCLEKIEGYILFIVDDQLNGETRAAQIIQWLEESNFTSKLICVLLTSRDNSDNQKFTKNIYVEYVKKSDVQKDIKFFEKAYIKSLYRIMLCELQAAKTRAIDAAFERAYTNHNSAIFFSKMANEEGELNFNFILRWISLEEKKYVEDEEKDIIKRTIALSNTLNNLEANDGIEEQDNTILYSYDLFDFMINYYAKPISAGDVFKINDEYYILIGQECDLALRKNGTRKTGVFEFIKADVQDWERDVVKEIKTGYEKVIINHFFDGEGKKYLLIDCSKRYFGKSDIFDMCTFNTEGKSEIELEKDLPLNIRGITTMGTLKLYGKIQTKLKSIIQVKNIIDNDKMFEDFGKNVVSSSNNTEAFNFLAFSINGDRISYPVNRICRLKKHFGLLQRLYLQYRGRQAEEAACFSRVEEFKYWLNDKECSGRYFLSSKASNNDPENIYKLPWSVNVIDLKDFISDEKVHGSENIVFSETSGQMHGIKYSKKYDKKTGRQLLNIEKIIINKF